MIRETQPRRRCEMCGNVIRHWRKGRRFCSTACSAQSRKTRGNCELCGEELRVTGVRFCSMKCRKASTQASRRKCPVCGKTVHEASNRYCSIPCYNIARRGKKSHTKTTAALTHCIICGAPTLLGRRCCSDACVRAAIQARRKPRPPCAVCGTPTSGLQVKYCSEACRKAVGAKNVPVPDPTPLEIRVRAYMIRAKWSDDERIKHACKGTLAVEWTVPGTEVVT